MDVVRKREAWAASNAIEDVDVEDDYESCWTECDEHDDEHDVDLLSELKKGLIEEFETMSSQLSSALGGTISTMVTFHVVGGGDDDDDASVLTLKRKISGGSTTTQFPMCGASAFKFKPGFFEISPVDVLSLKFVSNLLGLDDSATRAAARARGPGISGGAIAEGPRFRPVGRRGPTPTVVGRRRRRRRRWMVLGVWILP